MISKEEIKRTDKIHARADEAVQQIKDGHIITEKVVLYPDENDGEQVTWNASDLDSWPGRRANLLSGLHHRRASIPGVVLDEYDDPTAIDIDIKDHPYYGPIAKRGLVMYRRNAVFMAAFPAPDPYTRGDRAGEAERKT